MDKEQVDTLLAASRTSRKEGRSRWEPSEKSDKEQMRDLLTSVKSYAKILIRENMW